MISSELRQRVLELAAADKSPTRTELQRTIWLSLAAAAAAALGVFVLAGGARPTGRPVELMLATVALGTVVAVAASWIAVARGASLEGRRRGLLWGLLVAAPLALFAGKLAISAAWPGMTEAWPERLGLRCLGLFLAIAAAPLAVYLWMWRFRAVPSPGLHGATLGIAAGAMAWTLVDLWCPVAYTPHVILGHVVPLLSLAASALVWRLVRRP